MRTAPARPLPLKGPDGVGDAGLEDVVGVHQQGGRVGVELAVGFEGGVFVGDFLLLTLNHQSLIATKTNRIVRAAEGRPVSEFGR